MDGNRIDHAIQRIETALGRIDAAAQTAGSRAGMHSSPDANGAAMREHVSAALRDLDQLIESLEP